MCLVMIVTTGMRMLRANIYSSERYFGFDFISSTLHLFLSFFFPFLCFSSSSGFGFGQETPFFFMF